VDGLLGDLVAPWTDHPAELAELRTRLAHMLNRLGRIEEELHELHNDVTAIANKIFEEQS
jgi:uncharacterized protein (UPF0335 family)